jgi:hypothetical protein
VAIQELSTKRPPVHWCFTLQLSLAYRSGMAGAASRVERGDSRYQDHSLVVAWSTVRLAGNFAPPCLRVSPRRGRLNYRVGALRSGGPE